MLWAGRSSIDVYLGTRHVAISDQGAVVASQEVRTMDASIEALPSLVAESLRGRSATLNFWLSGKLCPVLSIGQVGSELSEPDRMQVVRAMVAKRHPGMSDADIHVVARAPGDAAMLAISLAQSTKGALRSMQQAVCVRGTKVCLGKIRPWWVLALNETLSSTPTSGFVSVRDCDSLTWVAGTDGCFSAAASIELDDPSGTQGAVKRALLSLPQSPARPRAVEFDPSRGRAGALVALFGCSVPDAPREAGQ